MKNCGMLAAVTNSATCAPVENDLSHTTYHSHLESLHLQKTEAFPLLALRILCGTPETAATKPHAPWTTQSRANSACARHVRFGLHHDAR